MGDKFDFQDGNGLAPAHKHPNGARQGENIGQCRPSLWGFCEANSRCTICVGARFLVAFICPRCYYKPRRTIKEPYNGIRFCFQ